MRCLWITRQDPRPANSGELIYTLGLVRALAAQEDISLTVLAHQAGTPAPREADPITWELHGTIPKGRIRGMFSGLPSDAFRLGNPTMRATLPELYMKHPWDWILIDQAACGWILNSLPENGTTRVAYLAHNHESAVRREVARDTEGSPLLRAALRWDAWKYARLEAQLCRRADLITAITPRDQKAFQQHHPHKVRLVLRPGYDGTAVASPPTLTPDTPRRVVLAGAFEWLAKRRNLESFLNAAEPLFRAAAIQLRIVGKADPDYFSRLKSLHPWVDFHANVPSIDPYLTDVRLGLIPESLGGGFKLKALDYIFRGIPLASIRSALSGLPIDESRDVVAAETPADLALAITHRIDDLEFLNAAAHRSLAACRDAFHWQDRGSELARVLHLAYPPQP